MVYWVKVDESSHWYWEDGTPCYEVPMKTKPGQMRKTHVGDAKDLNLLPSVSTIKGMVAAPGLEAWKINQYLMAALSMEKRFQESDEDFALRVVMEGRREGKEAAEFGESIHDVIEKVVLGEPLPALLTSQQQEVAYTAYDWIAKHGLQVVASEFGVANLNWGYAGRGDWLGYISLKPYNGKLFYIDWKTQRTTPGKPMRMYPEWNMQASALKAAIQCQLPGEEVEKLNVVFSSTEPGRVETMWWMEDDNNDWGWRTFVAALVQYYSPLGNGEKLRKPKKVLEAFGG